MPENAVLLGIALAFSVLAILLAVNAAGHLLATLVRFFRKQQDEVEIAALARLRMTAFAALVLGVAARVTSVPPLQALQAQADRNADFDPLAGGYGPLIVLVALFAATVILARVIAFTRGAKLPILGLTRRAIGQWAFVVVGGCIVTIAFGAGALGMARAQLTSEMMDRQIIDQTKTVRARAALMRLDAGCYQDPPSAADLLDTARDSVSLSPDQDTTTVFNALTATTEVAGNLREQPCAPEIRLWASEPKLAITGQKESSQ